MFKFSDFLKLNCKISKLRVTLKVGSHLNENYAPYNETLREIAGVTERQRETKRRKER